MGKLSNLGLWSAVFLSSTTLVLACSSSSGGGSSVSADQASTDVSKSFCTQFNSCAPLFVQVAYGTESSCETRFKLSVLPTLSANGTGATPAQYESCATDIAKATCDDLLTRNYPASCQTAAGTLADGAACGDDAQCKDKLCRKGAGQTCGACSSLGAAGGACTGDSDCAYGLNCTNSVCSAYAAAGAACDATHTCDPTLTCSNGTCATVAEAGGTCAGLGQGGCDNLKGLYCTAAKVCAQAGIANAGQPCGLVSNVYTVCGAAGYCKTATGSTTGTCEAAAADGAACDTVNGPQCTSPAICTSGVCKISDPSTCN